MVLQMNDTEKRKFVEMESNVKEMMHIQKENSVKLDEILVSLKGDTLGNKGLVARIVDLEYQQKIYEADRTRNNVYIRIITWLIGVIAIALIGFIINTALAKKEQRNSSIESETPKQLLVRD